MKRILVVILAAVAALAPVACKREAAPMPAPQNAAISESKEAVPATDVPQEEPPPLEVDAETQKALDEIARRWDTVSSLKAAIETHIILSGGGDAKMELRGMGTYQCLRQDGGDLVRAEVVVKQESAPQPQPGETSPPQSSAPIMQIPAVKVLHIFDGEYVYEESAPDIPQKPGSKQPVAKAIQATQEEMGTFVNPGSFGQHPLEFYREQRWRIDRLPDEKAEDRDTYVFKAFYASGSDSDDAIPQHKVFFDKETGALLRIEYSLKAGTPLGETVLKKIEINPALDPAMFVYMPGPEVDVRGVGDLDEGDIPPPPAPPEPEIQPAMPAAVAPAAPGTPKAPSAPVPPGFLDAKKLEAPPSPENVPEDLQPVPPTDETTLEPMEEEAAPPQ